MRRGHSENDASAPPRPRARARFIINIPVESKRQ